MISARTSLRISAVILLALALSAFAAPASDFSGTYTLGARQRREKTYSFRSC